MLNAPEEHTFLLQIGAFFFVSKGFLYNRNMMETLNYDPKYWKQPCPQIECKKKPCCCGLKYVLVPSVLTAVLTAEMVPEKGRYSNAIVEYEETGAVYIYSAEGIPVLIKEGNAS